MQSWLGKIPAWNLTSLLIIFKCVFKSFKLAYLARFVMQNCLLICLYWDILNFFPKFLELTIFFLESASTFVLLPVWNVLLPYSLRNPTYSQVYLNDTCSEFFPEIILVVSVVHTPNILYFSFIALMQFLLLIQSSVTWRTK